MSIQAENIISFWYSEEMHPYWFKSNDQIDQLIRDQFYDVWLQVKNGNFNPWLETAKGCLAQTIILDQFPLNMFRGEARGFSTESQAISVSRHAIESALDRLLEVDRRAFLYMPLMHSENMEDQDLSVAMFEAAGLEANLRFAKHHRSIIERFGRFPHRNAILGRNSTGLELEYLNSDSAFKG